jgi:large subunit ribosomal protein L11
MKLDVSYAPDVKSIAKEIIGSCLSLGIKVEDKVAKELYADVSAGKYDVLFE